MPEILHRCVEHVMGQGHDESSAYAICRTSLGLKSDGSEDGTAVPLDDEAMQHRVAIAMQFQSGPALIKEIPICGPMGKFVNGEQSGNMTKARLSTLIDRFKKYPRQVPIFMLGEHPEDNDSQPPVGWVEGLRLADDGTLMARVKLHGPGASAVGGDLIRGASIYTVIAKDYDGSTIGEVLKHVLLTNEPFYKDLNIAASHIPGGESAVCVFTAFSWEARMADKDDAGKKPPEKERQKVDPTKDEPTVADLKAKDDEIVTLKGKLLVAEEAIEDLKEKLDARPVDVEKEEQAVRLKAAEYKLDALEIRELVFKGLNSGTLKPSHCKDYNQGGYQGTMSWFKASKFWCDDFTTSKKLLAWAVENNPSMYRVGRQFSSGASGESTAVVLTSEDRALIRKMNLDEEAVEAAMKGEDPGAVMKAKS